MPEPLAGHSGEALAWGAIYTLAAVLSLYWGLLGWTVRRLRQQPLKVNALPPVSILVATHRQGEAEKLLRCLAEQQYEAPWEVVVILDRLSPQACEKVQQEISRGMLQGQVVQISETPPGWSPKKYALYRGLAVARYEWIVVLDADTQVEAGYLRRLLSGADAGVEAIVGPGWLQGKGAGVSLLSAWEAALIQIESVGRAALGYAYMATGRGWAVRKAWLQTGLYLWKAVLSGDDDLTLQLIPRRRIRASGAATISPAPRSWADHLRRKARHLRTGRYYGKALLLSLGIPVAGYLLLWGVAFSAGEGWMAPLMVWFSRWAAVMACGAPVPWWAGVWDTFSALLQGLYPPLAFVRVKQW